MQKSNESEDLRVRRTRKMLQEAMIALTVEKGFAAITIADITERAMVNRSTFYRHYLDKCALLGHYMSEVYALVEEDTFMPEWNPDTDAPPGLVRMLKHMETFADFYRVMLGSNGDPGFTHDFRKNTEKRFRFMISRAGTEKDPKSAPVEMRLSYVSYAGIGAIAWWLENHQPCTAEQLALWISQLSSASAGLAVIPFNPTPAG